MAVLLFAALLAGGHLARADTGDEPSYADFYLPAYPLPPGNSGDVIRTEPSRLVLEPSGQLGAIMATGTRIIFCSKDTRGKPIAVTGTLYAGPLCQRGRRESPRQMAVAVLGAS